MIKDKLKKIKVNRFINLENELIADLGDSQDIDVYDNEDYYLIYDLDRVQCMDEIKYIPASLLRIRDQFVKYAVLNFIVLKKMNADELRAKNIACNA